MDRPEQLGGCDGPKSHCVVALLHGPPLTLFHPALVETTVDAAVGSPTRESQVELSLDPGRLVVIGRARGYEVPYLDPTYQATPLVPETGQSVLSRDGRGDDVYVSR
ncbi:MAG TPA: hypothetical protein VLM40_05530, partial [Gemmata sp.]|nr:hypothetical protein [Gemmata sp.]